VARVRPAVEGAHGLDHGEAGVFQGLLGGHDDEEGLLAFQPAAGLSAVTLVAETGFADLSETRQLAGVFSRP
jgi:hypothetical protein